MQSVGGAVREIDEINPQQIDDDRSVSAAETIVDAQTNGLISEKWRAMADEDGHYCFAVAL
jgi:hypothetical protein